MSAAVGSRRILVVGAGFAGLYAAMGLKAAAAAGHRVTVVNEESFFQYQPFLPEVASGTIDPRAAVVPLRRVLKHCRIVIGEVTRVDHAVREAHVRTAGGDERKIGYDIVVLAPGSRSRVLPVPGLAEHGIGFKTVQEAIYLRNHVLAQLDVAASEEDATRRRAALTFVFVGGGYAGVEALGELEDLARDAIENYPDLDASEMRWVLADAADRILPELPEGLASYAQDLLQRRGIEVKLATRLESAEDGLVRLSDGDEFPAETLVWTAGVKPSPLARESGLPVDEQGRLLVDRYPPRRRRRGHLGRRRRGVRSRRDHRGTVPTHRATRTPSGEACRGQHRGVPRRRRAPAVRVREHRRGLLARPVQGGRDRQGAEVQRVPRMVPAPLLPPARDADVDAAREDRDGLDGGAALPSRPGATRFARATSGSVRTGVGRPARPDLLVQAPRLRWSWLAACRAACEPAMSGIS